MVSNKFFDIVATESRGHPKSTFFVEGEGWGRGERGP